METDRGLVRCVALLGLVAIALLLWAPEVQAGLQPTYVSCNQGPPDKNGPTCAGGWHVSRVSELSSSLVGYVDQTNVSGTTPVYLNCTLNPPVPKASPSCSASWYIAGTANTQFATFIGYVYTSQIAGTLPVYLTCHLAPPVPKAQPHCQDSWFATPTPDPSTAKFTSFIGYVYVDPPVSMWTLSPKYFIGSVIYVPPGQGPSTVTYSDGTVTGTTLTTTNSWSDTVSGSITVSLGKSIGLGGDISWGENFSETAGGSSATSIDMVNTSTTTTAYKGPPNNTVNHDYDQIVIYLGVKLAATEDYLNNLVWSVDFSQILNEGYSADGYPIAVGCIRPNSTIPASQCTDMTNFLASVGITPADYPTILGADPFADPSAPLHPDPLRYVPLTSVAFIPDPTTVTTSFQVSNNNNTTNTQTTSYSYVVNVGVNSPILKLSNQLTLSNSSALSNKTGSTKSSTVTLSLPNAPYPGPATLYVYMDTVYKTFMFSFYQ